MPQALEYHILVISFLGVRDFPSPVIGPPLCALLCRSAVIIGCTELPLILTNKALQEHGEAPEYYINPTQVLADEVLRRVLMSRARQQCSF